MPRKKSKKNIVLRPVCSRLPENNMNNVIASEIIEIEKKILLKIFIIIRSKIY